MSEIPRCPIHERPELRNRTDVFRDREHAGTVLADMLQAFQGEAVLVLAIPAGGVPVAAAIARVLKRPLAVGPVSKILLPWTTEAGCGAVAFDGSSFIDRDAVARFGLTEKQLHDGTQAARDKVTRRVRQLGGGRPPDVKGRVVVVVDDGIAAGSTMRVAMAALRKLHASRIILAVPTAPLNALETLASDADAIYCANVRDARRFAVADAYRRWTDVTDDEAAESMRSAPRSPNAAGAGKAT